MALSASQAFVLASITRLATFNAQILLSAHPALKPASFQRIRPAGAFAVLALRLLSVLLPAAGARTAQLQIFAGVNHFAAIAAGVPANPAHCSGCIGHSPVFTYDAFAARVLFVALYAILRH